MSRRRRRRLPANWTEGFDLFDYAPPPAQRRSPVGAVSEAPAPPLVVGDDWPDIIPITDAELRVIEGHMREELDRLFGPLP